MKFPVVLHKETNTEYGVIVPDVIGCYSAGKTVEEALDSTREALSLHFEGLVEDNETLPEVSSIEDHLSNPEYEGGIWAFVEFDTTPYSGKAVRFNATLPEKLLCRIDERVKQDNRYASRSGFLASAALHELSI